MYVGYNFSFLVNDVVYVVYSQDYGSLRKIHLNIIEDIL